MNNNGNSAVKAGIMGVLAGMIAGAAIVVLSNESNRQKIRSGLNRMDEDAREKLADFKESVGGANSQTKKALAKNLKTFVKQLEA